MKNFSQVFIAFMLLSFSFLSAQNTVVEEENQVSKGKWFIETSTTLNNDTKPGTTIYFESSSNFNLGLEGGYFIMKNLTIKGGLGYGEQDVLSTFSYKIGAKYYLLGRIPLGLNYSGSINKYDDIVLFPNDFNKSYLDFSAGYAFFIGKFISIEPSLNLNYDFDDHNNIKLNPFAKLGFSLHF